MEEPAIDRKLQELKELQQVTRINESNKVTKSNFLVEAVYDLKTTEQKLLLCIISLISPNDEDFKTYRVSAQALKEILDVQSNTFHEELKVMTHNILKKPFIYIDEETNTQLQGAWFATCEYKDNEGIAEFEFSPKIRNLLLGLVTNFTTYTLRNVVKLKSKYSVRLYEILKKSENMKIVIFLLSDLKRMLGIDDDQYTQWSHFRTRVLETAQKEIKQFTDITFTYKGIKSGRSTDRVRFVISPNTSIKNMDEIDLFELKEVGYLLLDYGVSQKAAVKLVKEQDDDYLRDRIRRFEFERSANPKKVEEVGTGTYLYNLITHPEWENPAYEEFKAEMKNKQKDDARKAEEQRVKKLQEEYLQYIKEHTPKFENLPEEEQERIHALAKEKVDSMNDKAKKLKPETRKSLIKDYQNEILLEEYKSLLPSLTEWQESIR